MCNHCIQHAEYETIAPGVRSTKWFDDIQLNSQEVKMDVEKFVKATSMYLKAEDVKKNPTAAFVITTEGELETSEKFGTEKISFDGEYAGEQKRLSLSKTNARTVAAKLGTDTKKWIGHKLFLEVYKTKTSDAKLVDAINVSKVE